MTSIPGNSGGPPPPGWHSSPYNHTYHPQQQYPNQHHTFYGGAAPTVPPQHQHPYPMGQQPPPYHHYQGNPPTAYPPTRNGASNGAYHGASGYGDPHGPGQIMAQNPPPSTAPSYGHHHQPLHSYQQQQQQYSGYHPKSHLHSHQQSEESVERGMGSDGRPTPTSDGDPHESSTTGRHPQATPRPDSQQQGQYGHYGPTSSAAAAAPATNGTNAGMAGLPPYSSQNHSYHQQHQVHTPVYPGTHLGQPGGQTNMSSWTNYMVGTPGNPTPPIAPTPNSNFASSHGYPASGGHNVTPANIDGSNSLNRTASSQHPTYYQGNQQNYSNQNSTAASFPAPPPFPYQQRRIYPIPPQPPNAGIPLPRFDPPATGNPFDPPITGTGKGTGIAEIYDSKEKSLEGTRRRFSFGTQVTAKPSNSTGPNAAQDGDRSPSPTDTIPAPALPPQSAPPKFRTMPSEKRSKVSEAHENNSKLCGGPLQESRHQNVMLSKFEQHVTDASTNDVSKSTAPKSPSTEKKPKLTTEGQETSSKTPSFDDASLLLGLRTHSNNNSPETVPATVSHDSHEEIDDTHEHQRMHLEEGAEECRGQHLKQDEEQLVFEAKSSQSMDKSVKKSHTLEDPSLPSLLPAANTNNMVPIDYPRRLLLPNDAVKLNSLHCFIRAELLEIFVIEPSSLKNTKQVYAPSSSVGRVGLRCVHCAMARRRFQDEATKLEKEKLETPDRKENNDCESSINGSAVDITDGAHIARDDEAPMAVFYPKSISEIYRLVTSWQRCHLRKCRNVPPTVRAAWNELRETDKSRGKTTYWVTSAKELGLIDCTSRAGGIRFRISDLDESTKNEEKNENSSPLHESKTNTSENISTSKSSAGVTWNTDRLSI